MSALTALVLDGPCAGTYDVARATKRMVFTRAADGRCYALDEDSDKVEAGEQPFIYETDGSVGWVCGRGPGMPGRTVTFQLAATMDPATGEVTPLSPAELEAERKAARQRVIAWATGQRAPAGERIAAAAAPHGPAQNALFS